MITKALVALLFVMCFMPAIADEGIVITLASDKVDVGTDFNGGIVNVFGATTLDDDIAITISGQHADTIVRRKVPVFGVWLNRDAVAFPNLTRYYDIAVSKGSKNWENVGIGVGALLPKTNDQRQPYQDALIKERQDDGLFASDVGSVDFISPCSFRVDFKLPENIPVGNYTIRAVLKNGDKILAKDSKTLKVSQVGIGGRAAYFAIANAWLYGLMCVTIAIVAGFIMSLISIRR